VVGDATTISPLGACVISGFPLAADSSSRTAKACPSPLKVGSGSPSWAAAVAVRLSASVNASAEMR
jgi:hypothetical protein